MKFDTALREYARQKIRESGPCEIVVGIPTYNAEATVAHVLETVFDGLGERYPDKKAAVIVSDGGSLDYTREVAQGVKPPSKQIAKIVTIYRGLPGKGTALRTIFEAAVRLDARVGAVFDSDLRSITPRWVPSVIDPVLGEAYDFVSPFYVRHKHDATITNNIAYSLTRALYGKRVRQPIGGDFGFSRRLLDFFVHEYVWESDIARFGVDIWMTTVALCEGFRVCESYLGAKVHDPKDPAASLGPMFRQVVGTLFGMMERYEKVWTQVKGSEPVPLLGAPVSVEPEPVAISQERLVDNYRSGFEHFGALWREIVEPDSFAHLSEMARQPAQAIAMPAERWARIVYDFAYTYLRWAKDRYKLVELMTPIYYGRIAGFVNAMRDCTNAEAEEHVERQAVAFEETKPYLVERLHRWKNLPPEVT